ncbi:MAG TPA: response regulator transcription factor [Bacteroidota bacterium]|nr:response regulator transcription factor [Bacteroidota bacterium]
MRILLVEDEQKVARFIQQGLEAEGYKVDIAPDGKIGEEKGKTNSYDLIILDVLLPKKDGFDVLASLRADSVDIPVLMLTARSATSDIVHGLDRGADDYLTKPFAFDELLARIRSLLRRSVKKNLLKVADLQIDAIAHKATRGGKSIDLTAREFALLNLFIANQQQVLSRERIAKEVWGYDFDPGTNIVDVYVNHLRKKIDSGFSPKLIHTVRGKGYVLSEKMPRP